MGRDVFDDDVVGDHSPQPFSELYQFFNEGTEGKGKGIEKEKEGEEGEGIGGGERGEGGGMSEKEAYMTFFSKTTRPIMYSYPSHEVCVWEKKKKIIYFYLFFFLFIDIFFFQGKLFGNKTMFKVSQSKWSKALSLESPGTTGEISMGCDESNKVIPT